MKKTMEKKTLEELRLMTHEELEAFALKLQDENGMLRDDTTAWIDTCAERKQRIETLTAAVKGLSSLL